MEIYDAFNDDILWYINMNKTKLALINKNNKKKNVIQTMICMMIYELNHWIAWIKLSIELMTDA